MLMSAVGSAYWSPALEGCLTESTKAKHMPMTQQLHFPGIHPGAMRAHSHQKTGIYRNVHIGTPS